MRPVKQKARRQSTEKQAFIVQETRKLVAAGVIREVRYPDWLANPVVVPKKGGEGTHVCRLHQSQQGMPARSVSAPPHRPDRRFHRRVRPAVLLGRLLRISPDQDGGRRR